MTELVEHGQLFIGGELTDPLGTDVIEVVSPHTEEVIGRVPHASRADVDRAVAAARKAFDEGPWPRMTLDERIEVVTRIKDAFAVRHEEFARIISSENGTPFTSSVMVQALASMMVWDAAITTARGFTYEERRDGVLGKILVRREPVGVVAAIVPWNVPQFTAAAKLAPALLSGCPAILKVSPETPWTPTCWRRSPPRPAYPKGYCPSFPPTARSASTWSGTRASTRSPSPARSRPANGSWRSPPAT